MTNFTAIARYVTIVGLFCANVLLTVLFATANFQSAALSTASMAVATLGLLMTEGQ